MSVQVISPEAARACSPIWTWSTCWRCSQKSCSGDQEYIMYSSSDALLSIMLLVPLQPCTCIYNHDCINFNWTVQYYSLPCSLVLSMREKNECTINLILRFCQLHFYVSVSSLLYKFRCSNYCIIVLWLLTWFTRKQYLPKLLILQTAQLEHSIKLVQTLMQFGL